MLNLPKTGSEEYTYEYSAENRLKAKETENPEASTPSETPNKDTAASPPKVGGTPADSSAEKPIFWYGFGQYALKVFAGFNQAISAELSSSFRAWWLKGSIAHTMHILVWI